MNEEIHNTNNQMQPLSSHLVLVTAEDYDNACKQVEDFFGNTLLVRYDRIDIQQSQSFSAEEKSFSKALHQGIEKNNRTLDKFINEFKNTGFQTVDDLAHVECGYPSKLLHIITHFLDGFIGIDSAFYNLIDDSHWLSQDTEKAIAAAPQAYWLIRLNGFSDTPDKVALVQA